MDLFTYLMAKKGHNTGRDLFSYLLGKKASGGSGTYTTFSGTSLNISNTIKAKIKKFMLNSTELTQDRTPTPDNPVDVNVITGSNNIKITDGTEEQNYPITLSSKNLFKVRYSSSYGLSYTYNEGVYTLTPTATNPSITFIFNNPIPAGTYYYSGAHSNLISFRNQNSELVASLVNADGVVTFSEPIYYLRYNYIVTVGENIILDFNQTQLEKGEEKTSYEPYFEPIEYCKIGNYADQFFKNTIDSEFYDSTLLENEWYLKKNIINYKIEKNTHWDNHINTNGVRVFAHGGVSNSYINYSGQKCNCFKYADSLYNYGGENTFQIGFGWVYIGSSKFADSTELNEFLTSHNVVCKIPTNSPEYIHISETDYPILRSQLENLYNNAKSYNGQTNITQTNDGLPFNISVDVKVS